MPKINLIAGPLGLLLPVALAVGQLAPPLPRFEVASIKPAAGLTWLRGCLGIWPRNCKTATIRA